MQITQPISNTTGIAVGCCIMGVAAMFCGPLIPFLGLVVGGFIAADSFLGLFGCSPFGKLTGSDKSLMSTLLPGLDPPTVPFGYSRAAGPGIPVA